MNKKDSKSSELQSEERMEVEKYYKKIMRFLEYYVLACFIMVTFVPLLDFSWVPGFVKLVYFTGFPLLIFIFVISLFKEPIQNLFANIIRK
ncbi:MAG: hypothetical protein JSW33_04335 [bacterium]|nr:MAG: hypothetical protein JSW33_04335 [bacterium]